MVMIDDQSSEMTMPSTEETLTVTQFKARCLELFDRLNSRRLDKVTVTRRGRPVALVTPVSTAEAEARAVHGSMAGMVSLAPGVDLTRPVFDEEFDAAGVILHR
jgi:antitoxin (DNA-binding transcriptional repressor) of toxin-antitoxin stability system